VSSDDRNALKTLDRDLKNVVFGQNKAIDALVSAIRMARSGLGNPRKPIGNFLFSGPTGVGKTEVARQLAYCLGVELIRFDMSEYMERHAVSRLIGAPPGYVGFDQGGQLTESVTKHPYSVVLLDEIEKAHPDIFNILLQVMDHGTLTDNNGRKADFRNVIIIMTTNAGATELSKTSMGFTQTRRPATRWARSSGCSRRSSGTVSTRPSRSARSTTRSSCASSTSSCSSSRRSCTRRRWKPRSRGAQGVPREEGLRSADGRAPDGASHPGHDPQGAGRRAPVRPPRQRRQGDHRHGDDEKVKLTFEEAPKKEEPEAIA
jgi:hypothetical protein